MPAIAQTNSDINGPEACMASQLATKALIAFIGGRPVSYRQVDYDRKNNRPVPQCRVLAASGPGREATASSARCA
jgi:hypothetical protein